jgi:Protein of unknown function (DUF3467)
MIPLHERELKGKYTNYFKVGYNAFEFVLDFGQYYPENEESALHTRIITNPTYANAFLKVLRESLEQYERDYNIVGIQNHDP